MGLSIRPRVAHKPTLLKYPNLYTKVKLEKAWSAKGTKKYILVQIFSRLASGCSGEFLWGIPMNWERSERGSPLSPSPLGMPFDVFIWLQKAESSRRGIEALKNCEWDAPSCQITETKPLSGILEGSRAPGVVFRVWWEGHPKCREVRKGGHRSSEKWVFGFLLPPFLGCHETITTQVLRTNCAGIWKTCMSYTPSLNIHVLIYYMNRLDLVISFPLHYVMVSWN